jgi:hypothetical protein
MALIFWNKLENSGGVSEVGPNLSVSGSPSFPPAEFNNGVYTTASSHIVMATLDSNFRTGVGTIEAWIKTDYNVVDGKPQDGNLHSLFNLGRYSDSNAVSSLFIFLHPASGYGLNLQWSTTGGGGLQTGLPVSSGLTWNAGTLVHIRITWDYLAGSNHFKIYLNGLYTGSGGGGFSDDSLNGRGFWIGVGQPGDWSIPFNGVHDNLKVYNDVHTAQDFYFEGDGIPINVAASKGTYSYVHVSWDTVVGYDIEYMVQRSDSSGGTYTDLSGWQSGVTYDDISAVAGISYYYKVKARSMANLYEGALSAYDSGYAVSAGPTPTPTGFVASTTLINKITTSWNVVSGAQYRIWRSPNPIGPWINVSGWLSIGTLIWDDISVTPFVLYFYYVTAKVGIESTPSSTRAGHCVRGPVVNPPNFPTVTEIDHKPITSTRQPKVFVNGYNVYPFIAKMFNVSEEKTFKRSKLMFNDFQLDLNNFDNIFSRDNPLSLFYGQRLYMPVQIYNRDGILIFDGIMLDLTRDHVTKVASIHVSDRAAILARTKIEYYSSTWESPAMAVKNIMDKYGANIYYDLQSLMTSDAIYTQNNALIKCNVKLDDNAMLTSIIEKLAEIGCADAFIHSNKLRFDHWSPFTAPASSIVNLQIKDLLAAPKISILFSEIVNDYRIRYTGDGEIPVTDSAANNIGALSRNNLSVFSLPEIQTSNDAQIQIKDKATAIYFGECLIRRTHTKLSTNPNPIQVIDISLPIQDREWINILSKFALTFSEEGWTNRIFEVMKIVYDDDANKIDLTAYEVPT